MAKPLEVDQQWLDRIVEQVNGLQYGSVNITVHDGRIVQIDRTERTRYDSPSHKQSQHDGQGQSKPRETAHAQAESLRAVQ
ncbi:YezD family protein [Paenibacillus sp. GCM10023252]|uniref:YezD family protein n=1 Tax=Paenibacillus sp. GCM10023252 TaxID=3252649 RepID=UPI0036092DD8